MNKNDVFKTIRNYLKITLETSNKQSRFTTDRIVRMYDLILDRDIKEYEDENRLIFDLSDNSKLSYKQGISLYKEFPQYFLITSNGNFVFRDNFFIDIRKYLIEEKKISESDVINEISEELKIHKKTSLFDFYNMFNNDKYDFSPENADQDDLFDENIPEIQSFEKLKNHDMIYPVKIKATINKSLCDDDLFTYLYCFQCPQCNNLVKIKYEDYKNIGLNMKCYMCIKEGYDKNEAYTIKKENIKELNSKTLYHYSASIGDKEDYHIVSFNKLHNQKYELRGYLSFGKHMKKLFFLNINARPLESPAFVYIKKDYSHNFLNLVDTFYYMIENSGISINKKLGKTAIMFYLISELPYHFGYDDLRIMHLHIFGPQSVGKSFLMEVLSSMFYSNYIVSSGSKLITDAGLFGAANQDIHLPEYSIKRAVPGALAEPLFFHEEMLSSFIDMQTTSEGKAFIDTYKDIVLKKYTNIIKANGGKLKRGARIINSGNYDKTYQKKIESFIKSAFNKENAFNLNETTVAENQLDLGHDKKGYSEEFLKNWNDFDIDRDLNSDYYTEKQRNIIKRIKSTFENDKIEFYTGLYEELFKRFCFGIKIRFKARSKIKDTTVNAGVELEKNKHKLYIHKLGTSIADVSSKDLELSDQTINYLQKMFRKKYIFLWNIEPNFGTRYFIPILRTLMRLNNEIKLPSKDTLDILEKFLYFSCKQISLEEFNTFEPEYKIDYLSNEIYISEDFK